MELIQYYFPDLSQAQKQQIERFATIFKEWNEKINMVSRKDIQYFEERHLLHSLAVALFFKIPDNSRVLDVGTGGGLPGIPLAIYFPNVQFTLVDSIGKKIKVVQSIVEELQLPNVKTLHSRVEDINGQFDFVSGRAVKSLPVFCDWVRPKLNRKSKSGGILYLKGGDFDDELLELTGNFEIFNIKDHIKREFFETKKLIYIQTK